LFRFFQFQSKILNYPAIFESIFEIIGAVCFCGGGGKIFGKWLHFSQRKQTETEMSQASQVTDRRLSLSFRKNIQKRFLFGICILLCGLIDFCSNVMKKEALAYWLFAWNKRIAFDGLESKMAETKCEVSFWKFGANTSISYSRSRAMFWGAFFSSWLCVCEMTYRILFAHSIKVCLVKMILSSISYHLVFLVISIRKL